MVGLIIQRWVAWVTLRVWREESSRQGGQEEASRGQEHRALPHDRRVEALGLNCSGQGMSNSFGLFSLSLGSERSNFCRI